MAKKLTTEEIAQCWICAAIVSAVGAQGKSTTAEAVALALRLKERDVKVFSADVQRKLRKKLGDCVLEIDIDLLTATAADPLAFLHAFSQFSTAIGEGPRDRPSVVLDTAATWDKNLSSIDV
jgi:hypothetical protein